MKAAIEAREATFGAVRQEVDALNTRVWAFRYGDIAKSGFPSREDADCALAAEKVRLRQVDEEKAAADTAAAEMTFARYFGHWIDEHASRTCSPKTLERYRELGAYLVRAIGATPINSLSTVQIQSAIHALSDHGGQVNEQYPTGRRLAPKTVRHIGTLLYTALSEADRLGILSIPHPMANKRVKLPKLVKRAPVVLDEEKLGVLFEQARGTRLNPFVILAASTGCRRGELLALQWPDVDFTTGEVNVSKSLEQTKAGLRMKSTKSGEPRRFSVPEWALEVLKDHQAVQDNDKKMFGSEYAMGELVFCQPGGQPYSPDRIGARVVELMRKAGLAGVSLHSLRHSHGSILLSKGAPIAVVSQRLGHADQNITLSIYSHALPADSRAAAKIWSDALSDVVASSRKAGVARLVARERMEKLKLLKRKV